MIVERRTYEVQFGNRREVVDIIKTEMEAAGQGIVSRIYVNEIGPFNRVAHEMEFQNMAERDKFWAEWMDKRLTPEFLEKWTKIAPGGGNEIWILEE